MISNEELAQKDKNIVLIGFMGVGKTTIGQHLAKKLDREFIDIDAQIEQKYGMPVTHIFKSVGEKEFRQMEKDYILNVCSDSKFKIISLGGGAFLQEEIKNICLSTSNVIYLNISWETWKRRLHLIIDSRPILQNKSMDEIEALFYTRQNSYSPNHASVNIDGLGFEEAADHIIHSLNLIADRPDEPVDTLD